MKKTCRYLVANFPQTFSTLSFQQFDPRSVDRSVGNIKKNVYLRNQNRRRSSKKSARESPSEFSRGKILLTIVVGRLAEPVRRIPVSPLVGKSDTSRALFGGTRESSTVRNNASFGRAFGTNWQPSRIESLRTFWKSFCSSLFWKIARRFVEIPMESAEIVMG